MQMSRVGNLLICSKSLILMSDCERFAQITQDKWATVSKALRSLMTSDRPWAIHSGRSWQMSEWANSQPCLYENINFLKMQRLSFKLWKHLKATKISWNYLFNFNVFKSVKPSVVISTFTNNSACNYPFSTFLTLYSKLSFYSRIEDSWQPAWASLMLRYSLYKFLGESGTVFTSL